VQNELFCITVDWGRLGQLRPRSPGSLTWRSAACGPEDQIVLSGSRLCRRLGGLHGNQP